MLFPVRINELFTGKNSAYTTTHHPFALTEMRTHYPCHICILYIFIINLERIVAVWRRGVAHNLQFHKLNRSFSNQIILQTRSFSCTRRGFVAPRKNEQINWRSANDVGITLFYFIVNARILNSFIYSMTLGWRGVRESHSFSAPIPLLLARALPSA